MARATVSVAGALLGIGRFVLGTGATRIKRILVCADNGGSGIRDQVRANAGLDTVDGGNGDNGYDTLDAQDGNRDFVYCGPGTADVAIADEVDDVVGCEFGGVALT